MKNDKITIGRREYLQLRLGAMELSHLKNLGVEHWGGYVDALKWTTDDTECVTSEVAAMPATKVQ